MKTHPTAEPPTPPQQSAGALAPQANSRGAEGRVDALVQTVAAADLPAADAPAADSDWPGEDTEQLYLKALLAMEAAAWVEENGTSGDFPPGAEPALADSPPATPTIPPVVANTPSPSSEPPSAERSSAEHSSVERSSMECSPAVSSPVVSSPEIGSPAESAPQRLGQEAPASRGVASTGLVLQWEGDDDEDMAGTPSPAPVTGAPQPAARSPLSTAAGTAAVTPGGSASQRKTSSPRETAATALEEMRVTPLQVIEAVLFVGGEPISAKKLCTVLRGSFEPDQIERLIDELNTLYAHQGRPYEVGHVDGGYRLQLRTEFEPIRNRVFGVGPKEVRLSQEVLEVLALVAYKQPIPREDIEKLYQKPAGAVLRQLLRRELIALERVAGSKEVTYRTTPRFLSLFGLGSLNELPVAEDISLK